MSQTLDPNLKPTTQSPATTYRLLCLLALVVLTALLMEKNLGLWSLIPGLLALMGLQNTVRIGPPIVLVVLIVLLLCHAAYVDPAYLLRHNPRQWLAVLEYLSRHTLTSFSGMDLLLAAAVLAYTAGYYRLLGLEQAIFPGQQLSPSKDLLDGDEGTQPISLCRTPGKVPSSEVPGLLLVIPIWIVLGGILVIWLSAQPSPIPGIKDGLWRPILLIWIVGLVLFLIKGVLAWMAQNQASPDENRLYLQEQVWHAERRDLSRQQRWITWRRLQRQPREENS